MISRSADNDLCIYGDFNCSFAGNYYYTKSDRAALQKAFSENKIRLLTGDMKECINHIAISEKLLTMLKLRGTSGICKKHCPTTKGLWLLSCNSKYDASKLLWSWGGWLFGRRLKNTTWNYLFFMSKYGIINNDTERQNHILAEHVHGCAQTEIIYQICLRYILGFSDEIHIEKKTSAFVKLWSMQRTEHWIRKCESCLICDFWVWLGMFKQKIKAER